ncbi:hypothetical protein CL689_05995 [Candidatus Saccharibacteria bacterium]|nr:hypothetical protein [Candidatus Saccharibacteria bacterium]|tara:strand:- start:284 stop:934 length:651 start_codon:yes stop_codon:yes gene_type:complete
MFVPPPPQENLLIVRRSAKRPLPRSGLAVVLCAFCLGSGVAYLEAKDSEGDGSLVLSLVEQVDTSSFEVFQAKGIEASARDVRVLMKILDEREAQIAKENDAILRSRSPSEMIRSAPQGGNTRQVVSVEPTPTLRLPAPAAKIPSSGEWLNGDVLLRDSGLAKIDQSVAVFIRGKQRVDFRVGAVLPNGEVVLQVDPANLSVRTDRRLIQIIDDGS